MADATVAKAGQEVGELPQFQAVENLSYGASESENYLIQGENLAVLQDLLPHLGEAFKCVYIDPPYNNQESYNHYQDNGKHDTWLKSLRARIEILREFLTHDGSLWISIDDRQVHYLKVAADEIFGRDNFVTTIVWQQRTTRENRKVFSNNHEYILLYAKDYDAFKESRNQLPPTEELLSRYTNPDDDPRGPWQSVSANVQAGHATDSQFYEITAPNGTKHTPPKGRCWAYNKEKMEEKIENGEIWFGKDGNGVPRIKKYLSEADLGLTPETLWLADDAGTNRDAKKHLLEIFPDEPVFDTPKPEKLIRRVIGIATDPGDRVLDAYLGSGTTAAVAHKMDRNYLGIEKGQHAVTHCAERLRAVIEGETEGVSDEEDWNGGGGVSFLQYKESG